MPAISVKTFAGERPKVDPRLLPNESAAKAYGCHFDNGNLSPLKSPVLTGISVISNAKTIYKHLNEYWFSWDKAVNAVASPVANDPWQRVYFTGDGYPKVTNNTIFSGAIMPANDYRLGVQSPEVPIIAIVNDAATEGVDPNDDETRYYTHTFITEQGEEGPPGEASQRIDIRYPNEEGTHVKLSFSPPNVNASNITHRRIYRTATGGGIADYLFVAEIPISQSLFVDDISTDELGSSLDTYDYEMPNENMIGLTSMANGILAGFFDSTVCFSESYLPYAWPTGYQLTAEHEIVTVAALGNTLAVLTKGYPYLFSGINPDSMAGQKLESNQSCTSARSAVIVNGSLIYASPDGLIGLNGGGLSMLTGQIITREQWQEYEPSTIEAYHQEGRYLAFYGANLDKAFIFDPTNGDFRHFTAMANCGFNSLADDALYICQGKNLSKWEAGPAVMSYEWKSKAFIANDLSFACAMVKGVDTELAGLRIYADEVEVLHLAPGKIPKSAFRLPNTRGNSWSFEVYGKGTIHSVSIATTMREVAA